MPSSNYYNSAYHLGRWEQGLNRDVKTQVDNIRSMYRKGLGVSGQLKPYESTCAALILLLDITDRDVNILGSNTEQMGQKIIDLQTALDNSAAEQAALRAKITELKKQNEALQPKVGANVGQSVQGKPTAGASRKSRPVQRKTTANR